MSGITPRQAAYEAWCARIDTGDPWPLGGPGEPEPWEVLGDDVTPWFDEMAQAAIDAHAAQAATETARPSRDELLDALVAVREAVDIPNPATVGDEEAHDRILKERVMHAVVMLKSILEPDRFPDVPWSAAYLRVWLAEHPAEGYRTWGEAVAELNRARQERGDASPGGTS